MTMFKKNGGFTLVELIVVIAILAILAGVAIPAYSGYITKAKDAQVVVDLDAVATAAQAANATAGAISKIEVKGTAITVTATPKDANFDANFKLFYGYDAFQGKLDGTSYAAGAVWENGKWAPAT